MYIYIRKVQGATGKLSQVLVEEMGLEGKNLLFSSFAFPCLVLLSLPLLSLLLIRYLPPPSNSLCILER